MQLLPILQGWIVASALLIAEHIALWEQPWRLEAPWNYVVGLGTVLLGCLVWAVTARGPVAPLDAWGSFVLVSTSGGWITLGYYVRGRQGRRKKAQDDAVRAIRLTQELIDAGGQDATRQPELRDRRN